MKRLSWLVAALMLPLTLIPRPTEPPSATRPPTPSPILPAVTVLSVGDSLTAGTVGGSGASYRPELSRLMTAAGQPHTWAVAAVPGTTCAHWAARLDGLITQYHPRLILLECGTNDTPSDATEADYRSMLATARARGVPLVAALVGLPDMLSPTNITRPWIEDWMHATNEAIKRALAAHPGTPVADMQRVPGDPEWLQDDGIHLTERAERAYAQLFYEAARAVMAGWKTLAQMGIRGMCGLRGHWRGDPRPVPGRDYIVCLD